MTVQVQEQASLLGPRKSLVAIVSTRRSGEAATSSPAIVILNAGIIHRVGPNRMFVELARRLAAAGHVAVRFDLSGIGDSEARTDGLAPFEATLTDIREALDSLGGARKLDKFILIGLCSGADQAVAYAGRDPRVVGIVQIDASIPRTPGYYVNHYRGRLFRLSSWLNFLSGRHPLWQMMASRAPPPQRAGEVRASLQNPDVRAFLESAYGGALGSGVSFLSIFTSGLESQHNYREQLLDAFPSVNFGAQMQLEYFDATDHTFTPEKDREALLQLICGWVRQQSATTEPQLGQQAS